MNENIRITYPSSEKVYMRGTIHPELRVGMRKITLTPTVRINDGKRETTVNAPVYVYITVR